MKFILKIRQCTLCFFIPFMLTACNASSTIKLTHIGHHDIIAGKTTTIALDAGKAGQNFVLMPGGPYANKRIDVDQTVQFIEVSEQFVYAITSATDHPDNHLLIIDFQQDSPNPVTRHKLTGSVNKLLLVNKTLFLGMQDSGLSIMDVSNPHNIKTVARFKDQKTINDLHMADHQVYALSNQQQILVFKRTSESKNAAWQLDKTLHIPGHTNSIAVKNNRLYATGPATGLRAFNLQKPETPVDQFPLQGQGKQIRLSANTAYVADGTGGLIIFDISNPDNIKWLGSHNKFNSIQKTVAFGNHLVALDGQKRIATLNISRLSLPITGSFYKPAAPILDIASYQHDIYLATGSSIERLMIPSKPQRQISNEGVNQGGSRRAFINNDIAYVADWFSGLHLYDISNPYFPQHLANYHTPGSSKGVIVKGKYAYVGDDDHGLQIIDISKPREPKKVSELLSTGLAYTMKMKNNLLYLADHRGGLHIIDVSNVKQPSIIGSFDTPGKSWAVDVADNIAYIADDTSGLLILDVSNPKLPQQIAQFNPDGYAEDVQVKDNIAYVSFFDKGLYILDVSNPQHPRQISQLDMPGNARSITLSNDYAFIAGWESGLQIVDISNINKPKIVANYDTNGAAWGVDIYQGYAYVWDWWGGVKIINVNNPRQPSLAGKYHTRGDIKNLKIKGNYIYTANGAGGVQVFDINNVLNPIWVTGNDSPGEVVDIWPTAHIAYSANGGNGISIFNISNPFHIKQQGHLETPGNALLVREYRQFLYVADSQAGLLVIDVRQPAHPKPLTQYPMTINDLWLDNGMLYAATTNQGLLRFKTQPNGTLIAQKPFNEQHNIQQVRSNNKNIFVSVNKVGVYILQDSAALRPKNPISQSSQTLTVVALLKLTENIEDIQVSTDTLYVATQSQGLLAIDIRKPSAPQVNIRYPATDHLGAFAINEQAAFFAGSDTISSVGFLPALGQQHRNHTQTLLTIPANLPLGRYHLSNANGNGISSIWPNVINVVRPKPKTPKLSQEDFKKLLEKHRAQQKPETTLK
ncbi:MAG: hypothetical protein GXP08_08025 [Gammaproteobacteria bacterium]|nr:hypothetical protein [Gammaproteobacteria bacterium]